MFFTPSEIHQAGSGEPPHQQFPQRFGFLCWNVNKRRNYGAFRHWFQQWSEEWNLELIFLQEARFREGEVFLLPDFTYNAAASLQIGIRRFGVLTAAKTRPELSRGLQTRGREGFLGPRKSLLLEYYPTPGGDRLLCVNLHGINFRENRRFERELRRLADELRRHRGPMIVAGDFNSWNSSRQERLSRFSRELDLHRMETGEGRVKRFMGYPLDIVLYRGLRLLRSEVVDLPKLSDHNPILAEFEFG